MGLEKVIQNFWVVVYARKACNGPGRSESYEIFWFFILDTHSKLYIDLFLISKKGLRSKKNSIKCSQKAWPTLENDFASPDKSSLKIS